MGRLGDGGSSISCPPVAYRTFLDGFFRAAALLLLRSPGDNKVTSGFLGLRGASPRCGALGDISSNFGTAFFNPTSRLSSLARFDIK